MNPQPKPTKASRPKGPVDTTGLRYAKEHPIRDAKYRADVRQHPCALFSSAECKGQIVCAHLTPPGQASRSMKYTDISCVPLCNDFHHALVDRRIWIADPERDALLVICWSKAIALREVWWRKGGDPTE